jgi:hypothetical protein
MDGQGLSAGKPLPNRVPGMEIESVHATGGILAGLPDWECPFHDDPERLGVGAEHFGLRGY